MTFTSSLTVADLGIVRRAEWRPLGQVFGACAYQIGYAARPYTSGGVWPGYPGPGYVELGGPTRAWNTARERALTQLRERAEALGADAVVGVRIGRRLSGGPLGTVQLVVSGTALALPGATSPLFTTTLGGTDIAVLRAAGYAPAGLLAASTVTQVLPGYRTSYAYTGQRRLQNGELPDLSRGPREARKRVLARLEEHRRSLDADGMVGVRYDQHVEGGEREGHGLTVTLHVLGTAVKRVDRARTDLDLVLDLGQEAP